MQYDEGDLSAAQIEDFQRYLHTGLPAKVVSWQKDKQTVTLKPMIQIIDVDGTFLTIPDLQDVLVQYPRGGGFVLTFPITEGDECFISFSERCIDAWWESGNLGLPLSTRMHDLSDGFAHFGFSSLPNITKNVDSDAIALRSVEGSAFVKINSAGVITMDGAKLVVKCPAEFEETVLVKKEATFDSHMELKGTFSNTATAVGAGVAKFAQDIMIGTLSLWNHKHSDAHGGDTGKPKN